MTMFKGIPSAVIATLFLGATVIGAGKAAADQVFSDDVIVQGSLCVGFDCVNNEAFGFDTVILKENNLRIFFNDTSVLAGFPTNDWRVIINDSASGGANFFAIEDSTAVRQVFKVSAGARENSIFVSSAGNVGFGTSTPGLVTHARNGNTPGIRFEQDASSGFSPQTWDIAGNEANFFVRDVTGGSHLPLRIRPGAPTSSIDIASTGNVGLGTASPGIVTGSSDRVVSVSGSLNPIVAITNTAANRQYGWYVDGTGNFVAFDATATANRIAINSAGNFGIGTTTPAAQLHTTSSVRFANIANCSSGIQSNASGDLACLVSSRQFKTIAGDLTPSVALTNVMALRPQVGTYKTTPDVPEHWLIAEDVAAVDPALVGYKDGEPYTVKTQNIVADLVAVIQQQQRRIDALEKMVAR